MVSCLPKQLTGQLAVSLTSVLRKMLKVVEKSRHGCLYVLNLYQNQGLKLLLSPFQNVGRFDFSKFIYFAMYLNIYYIYMLSKHYESRKTKMTYILELREYQFEVHVNLPCKVCVYLWLWRNGKCFNTSVSIRCNDLEFLKKTTL